MKNVIHAARRIKQLMKDMNPKITMKNVKMLLKVNDRDLLMQNTFFQTSTDIYDQRIFRLPVSDVGRKSSRSNIWVSSIGYS